jgi:hypothetical protein
MDFSRTYDDPARARLVATNPAGITVSRTSQPRRFQLKSNPKLQYLLRPASRQFHAERHGPEADSSVTVNALASTPPVNPGSPRRVPASIRFEQLAGIGAAPGESPAFNPSGATAADCSHEHARFPRGAFRRLQTFAATSVTACVSDAVSDPSRAARSRSIVCWLISCASLFTDSRSPKFSGATARPRQTQGCSPPASPPS